MVSVYRVKLSSETETFSVRSFSKSIYSLLDVANGLGMGKRQYC
jgi:hypothetical protein